MSDKSVWLEQIDSALIRFIRKHIKFNGNPVKVIVRKPEDDFYSEEYPVVSIYCLYDHFSRERYEPQDVVVGETEENLILEKSALPYDLSYQIDFWSAYQSDMNYMLKQWKTLGFWFNLTVEDVSGNERSCFVRSKGDFNKSDIFQAEKRLFHCSETFQIWTELDEGTQEEVPKIVQTTVHFNNSED